LGIRHPNTAKEYTEARNKENNQKPNPKNQKPKTKNQRENSILKETVDSHRRYHDACLHEENETRG